MSQSDNRRYQSTTPGKNATPPAGTRPDPSLSATKPTAVYRGKSVRGSSATRNFSTDLVAARMSTEARRRKVRLAMLMSGGFILVLGLAIFLVTSQILSTFAGAVSGIFQPHVGVRPGTNFGPDAPGGTSVPVVIPPWDGKEPINILLIGLDERSEEHDSRADTQIIVHIDPVAKTAAMISIPRDLWVDIPGYGPDRVNSAYQKGETDKATIEGGGPVLAMTTVQDNFGVPIHYYAQVNFHGFEQIVDTLGGVTIDVPRPLVDNDFPFMDYGATRVYISAGLQHMDGHTALEYARSRHQDSDIGRNSRQQQVLLALKQKANLDLLSHATDLAVQLSDTVHTDLSPSQALSLAQLARGVGASSIQNILIDGSMVNETIMADGADVLLPKWELIRPKIAQAFADPQVAAEAARLSVLNGTLINGTGRTVRDQLAARGMYVAVLDVAPDRSSHPVTNITDYTGGQKPHTLESIAASLGIPLSNVKAAPPGQAPVASDGKPVDILVVVGDDQVSK